MGDPLNFWQELLFLGVLRETFFGMLWTLLIWGCLYQAGSFLAKQEFFKTFLSHFERSVQRK